ncbi:hypothetical protein N7540_009203 [Penicillium herquei]|nr:hypothetical protein N7540_009203 [Penicillium herquei]
MQPSILIGFLAALSSSAHGLVFRDKISQVIDGQSLLLLHGILDTTAVSFGVDPLDLEKHGWKFNTEGYADDEAVITPVSSSETLQCDAGSKCTLDSEGESHPFKVARVDQEKPIFTFQDPYSGLYISRSSDLQLELTETVSDSAHFTLEKITT